MAVVEARRTVDDSARSGNVLARGKLEILAFFASSKNYFDDFLQPTRCTIVRVSSQLFAGSKSMMSSQICARGSLPGRLSQKSFRIYSGARCASALPFLSSREGDRRRLISSPRKTPGPENARSLATLPSMSTEQSRRILDEDVNRTEDIRTFLANWKPSFGHENIDPIALPIPSKRLKATGNMLNDDIIYRTNHQDLLGALDFQGMPGENDYSPFIRPGDMVLLQQEGGLAEGVLATYVRSVNEQHQFFTLRGKWRIAKANEITYYTKERIPSELLDPILPYFPMLMIEKSALPQLSMEGGVPRSLGQPLLSLMIKFEREAHELVETHTKSLANIYNEIADQDHFSIMTLDEIAAKVIGLKMENLTTANRYAIHKAMKRQAFYIIPNQSPSAIESYTIRPTRQSKSLANVINWVRMSQAHRAKMASDTASGKGKGSPPNNPIDLFVQKARKLIQASRISRQPTSSFTLGPKVEKPSSGDSNPRTPPVENFSKSDQEIIDYIRLWITPPSSMGRTLRSLAPVVLRLTGMYDDHQLDQATGYLFLQEIGVISPWENLHLLGEQLALPGHGLSAGSDKIVEECKEFCKDLQPDTLVDSMKHLRKDWGSLPVFCVDSASAAEIDDGFSIEPASDSPEASWIHIHVANPSAFIPPDHILAQGAAHFKRSLYSPDRIYPLFPPAVTHSQFSLAPKRPTITFSAKINKEGDVLDTRITNGYVNNIVYVTPSSVRKMFDIDYSEVPKVALNVGGTVQEPTRPELQDHVSEEHQATLKSLEQLLSARREKRKSEDSLEFISHPKSQPLVSGDNEGIRPYIGDNSSGYPRTKDPAIDIQGYEVDPFAVPESTKFDLVSHAMLLGGEIAATWAKERGLPLIYSGASHRPGQITKPNGEDDASQLALPRGFTSTKPVPHVTLGMEQYAKCTSPLRRYSDLLSHWQIEAALRHEAESKTQLKLSESKATLPFSEPEVEAIIARSEWQNRLIDLAQNRSREFWTYQLLFRAHYFNQAELPETFQCVIISQAPRRTAIGSTAGSRYLANLLPFRVRCYLTAPEDSLPSFKPGDIVEATIQNIDLYAVAMDVSATRLVTRREGKDATASLGFVI